MPTLPGLTNTEAALSGTGANGPVSGTQPAKATTPTSIPPQVAEARRLRAAGKPSEALAALGATSAAGENKEILVEQGLLSLEAGDMRRARTALTKANAQASDDWRIVSGLGVAQAGLGEHAAARKSFERALQLSPDNPTVLNNMALSYVLEGKLDEGAKALAKAANLAREKPAVAGNMAIAMALKNDGSTSTTQDAGRKASLTVPPSGLGGPLPTR